MGALGSLKKELFHFFEIHELAVAKALWAVSLIAVNTEVAVLVARNHVLASIALGRSVFLDLSDHRLLVLVRAISVLVDALLSHAQPKPLLLSSVQDQLVNQLVQHIVVVGSQLLNVEFLDALMVSELFSRVLLVADLAHYGY